MRKILFILEKNGFSYALRAMYLTWIEPIMMKIAPLYLKWFRRMAASNEKGKVEQEIRYWRANKAELLQPSQRGYRLKIEDFGLNPENLDRLKHMQQQSTEVVLADIDQDGFFLSYFGPIEQTPTISEDQFLTRKRFGVKVVAINGYVGIKKDYRGSKSRFANELRVLYQLGRAGCNTPVILDADFDNLILTFSYIPGPVLSQQLVKKGAVLHLRDVMHKEYGGLARKERRPIRLQEARRVLHEVIDASFVECVFAELIKIHAAGVIDNDIKYGNIITERHSGQIYWIDFEHAPYYPNLGQTASRLLRDHDIENFNLFFDADKLTYKKLKTKIKNNKIPAGHPWTAPVYFGSGLRIGSLWDVEAGYGRWHYFLKHHLPPLLGRRILNLGANNAFEAMQMLRQGAAEVVGLEDDSHYIAQGNFVKSAFEWADSSPYKFRYIQAELTDLPALHIGQFDLVTALNSWPCLDQAATAKLLRHLSIIAPTFIWLLGPNPAANGNTAAPEPQISAQTAAQSLRENGFSQIQIIPSRRNSRALIIASSG
jgi:tRNA A-37 threonylcarbamoyl transferase component Bud32